MRSTNSCNIYNEVLADFKFKDWHVEEACRRFNAPVSSRFPVGTNIHLLPYIH
jgi:hypothetical protein